MTKIRIMPATEDANGCHYSEQKVKLITKHSDGQCIVQLTPPLPSPEHSLQLEIPEYVLSVPRGRG
jgi:hypothetical protein